MRWMRAAGLALALGGCDSAALPDTTVSDRIASLEAEVALLRKQLAEVEKAPGPKGDPGPPGEHGAMGPPGPKVEIDEPHLLDADGNDLGRLLWGTTVVDYDGAGEVQVDLASLDAVFFDGAACQGASFLVLPSAPTLTSRYVAQGRRWKVTGAAAGFASRSYYDTPSARCVEDATSRRGFPSLATGAPVAKEFGPMALQAKLIAIY